MERDTNLAWISLWCDDKVIFQLSVVAIISHVNSWIDIAVFHPSISKNIGSPRIRISPDKIIALPSLQLAPVCMCLWICTQQFHAQGVLSDLSVWPRRCGNKLQISLFGRKQETVTRPVRDEIYFLICLPVVRFEALLQSRANLLSL